MGRSDAIERGVVEMLARDILLVARENHFTAAELLSNLVDNFFSAPAAYSVVEV